MGVRTERARKHNACACWCNVQANSTWAASAIVACGNKEMAVNSPACMPDSAKMPVGAILVGQHPHPRIRAEVKVPEHVAGCDGCDEQLFGIVARRIPPKRRISRARKHLFARCREPVVPLVAFVG